MQFMVFMIPAGYQPKDGKQQEFKPDPKKMTAMMAAMGKFNDEISKATKVLSVEGLSPLAKGARLAFAGGKPTVTDGPAIDAKEVVGGYWLVEARTKQQVIDWWKRCPAEDGDVIEIRPVADMSDFPEEVQKALQEKPAKRTGGTKPPQGGSKPPGGGTKAPGVAEASASARPMADMMAGKTGTLSTAPGTWKKPKTRSKEQD